MLLNELVILLLKFLFIANSIMVALHDKPWVPAVESEFEIPVEHFKLFQDSLVPLVKQSVPSFQLGNLSIFFFYLHSMKYYLLPIIGHVAALSPFMSNLSKGYEVFQSRY